MKKNTVFILFILNFGLISFAQIDKKTHTVFGKKISTESISPSGYIRCVSNEYDQYLRDQNPNTESIEIFEKWIQKKINEQNSIQNVASQSGGVIYIPVVVHVIHDGDAYGIDENISDEQVQSQIEVMNQDYRKLIGTPGYNTNPVGADTQVQFVLAKVDPNGNPTNGIDRVNLCQPSWSTAAINTTVKPSTIWDPTQYMNMWSVNFTNNTLLGYAQFPESSLGGMSTASQNSNTDGVVANYTTFGSSDLAAGNFAPPYDKGRTMTHEVGHFLGLRHIWGDNNSCPATNTANDKDFVADTPAANAANYGCPSGRNTCTSNPGNDMIENYMDYTDDTCMNIFTIGQKERIITVLNNSPRRSTLKSSVKDIDIPLFTNDAEVKIENLCNISNPTCTNPNPSTVEKTILLYNRGTSNMTTASLNYNINGGNNFSYTWTGNLAPNKYAEITLPNSAVNGLLSVNVTTVNGVTDQRVSNNIATKTFGSTLPYANSTTFTFTLVGDSFGSETTWSLKNQSGVEIYSGGPYSDITSGTQTLVDGLVWNLPLNGCYYLTVNDSYGDGLFDGASQGYYTVTSGSTTLINITDFVVSGNPANTLVSKINFFTNNGALESESFQIYDLISIYPIPSKNSINIRVPENQELKGEYQIYNNLGQKIITKNITSETDLHLNISSYANGVYFLNLKFGEFNKSFKFIKE